MQNKIYDSITTLGHFLLTILVIAIFLITSSKYLIIFSILLPVYLILLNCNYLDKYLNVLKNYILIILIAFVICILVVGHMTPYLLLKFIVVVMLITNFICRLTFKKVNSLFYKLLILFPNRDILSYKITLKLYYINKIFTSRDEIIAFKNERGSDKTGFKYGYLTRRQYALYKTEKLDNNFKTNFYRVPVERANFISIFLVLFFILILVLAIIRK